MNMKPIGHIFYCSVSLAVDMNQEAYESLKDDEEKLEREVKVLVERHLTERLRMADPDLNMEIFDEEEDYGKGAYHA
jgi:uncharacterized protein YlaN (UPF0358 family)